MRGVTARAMRTTVRTYMSSASCQVSSGKAERIGEAVRVEHGALSDARGRTAPVAHVVHHGIDPPVDGPRLLDECRQILRVEDRALPPEAPELPGQLTLRSEGDINETR